MQAPLAPVDIKIALGNQSQSHNLIKFESNILQGSQNINNCLKIKDLASKEDEIQNLHLYFDFYVEQGRQKEAVEYFDAAIKNPQDPNLSPLQRIVYVFKDNDKGKLTITEHKGFVRLYYNIYPFALQNGEFNEFITSVQSTGIDLTCDIEAQLKGSLAHNKKNRQNVKVDYAKCHLRGSKIFTSQVIDFLISSEMFGQQEITYINPYLDVIRKAKKAKINLKLDSFRKINKYYNSVAYKDQQKKTETKGFPYTNHGLFRQKCQFHINLQNKILVKVDTHFESEDVFIRLIKVYAKTLNKLFDTELFYD